MSNVISLAEIQKTQDNQNVVFPEGTLITPSARDWANDHGIKIAFGRQEAKDREVLLKSTVNAVLKEFTHKGKVPDTNTVIESVKSCLSRLGCKVEK